MKKQSLTITGLIVAIVSAVLQQFDLGFTDAEVEVIITGFLHVLEIAGIAVAWIERVRRGDVNLFGRRKQL